MKKISIKTMFVVVGLLVCSLCGMTKVFADGENSSAMIVSPMSQKLILTPGESVTASVNVSSPNDAKSNLQYSVKVGSFSQKKDQGSVDDYGTVDTDVVSNYNMMMNWIELDKDSGTVAPNQTDTITFTINVPKDAPAGGQYATILIKDDTKHAASGDGNVMIQSITQVASIIYAEVAGETRNEGKILENDLPGFLLSSPLTATSVVRNDGNVHTNAKYILQVWPLFSDEEICTNEENISESLVMPETEKYHAEQCNIPGIGIFKAKQTVKIFGEESTVEKIIIVCPLWLIFVIAFAIVAIIIYFVMRTKSRKSSRAHKEHTEAE